jgi:hypothetical protein
MAVCSVGWICFERGWVTKMLAVRVLHAAMREGGSVLGFGGLWEAVFGSMRALPRSEKKSPSFCVPRRGPAVVVPEEGW